MLCLDVNVLLYAHRPWFDGHESVRERLEHRLDGTEAVVVPDVVASGFLRIATNQRFAGTPSTASQAWDFVDALANSRAGRIVSAGPDHWRHFRRHCATVEASGNLVPDAFIAAYASELGATLVSNDRGFRLFDGLSLITTDDL